MRGPYPDVEPYDCGSLPVGDGNLVYWEVCGNPCGKPAIVLHGGPGSGCTPWHRRMFDRRAYRVVLFDQRGCGRSTPHASAPETDLSTNTTWSLIADIERLRRHLEIERWLVWGGSWGCTLALAYAQSHRDRVSEMILWGVTAGRRREFDWLFRGGLAALFPEPWEQFSAGIAAIGRDGDPVEAYHRLLHDPDPEVRRRAARDWCTWESATSDWPSPPGLAERFREPRFALAFARLVTHYARHEAWLEDRALIRDVQTLADVPATLINGRFDLQAPLATAWELARSWPGAELVVVDGAGHAPQAGIAHELIRASDGYARR